MASKYVDLAREKRGLAVVINNSLQTIPALVSLKDALINVNYDVEIFHNLLTVQDLETAIRELKFPPYVNPKLLQKTRMEYQSTSTFNREQIYSNLESFNPPLRNKGATLSVKVSNSTAEPSLLVIYLGESCNNELLLNKNYVTINLDWFMNLFRQDFSDIPKNICQIFTFVTIEKNIECKSLAALIDKRLKRKKNNIVNVQLLEKENGFRDFVQLFTKFISNGNVEIKDIDKYLNNKKDLIKQYNIYLYSCYKFQRKDGLNSANVSSINRKRKKSYRHISASSDSDDGDLRVKKKYSYKVVGCGDSKKSSAVEKKRLNYEDFYFNPQ